MWQYCGKNFKCTFGIVAHTCTPEANPRGLLQVWDQSGWYSEFKAIPNCIARPWL